MSANTTRSRRPAPMILPDDLYDYADERPQRRGAKRVDEDRAGVDCMAVIDDWPDRVPVTEAEIDVFERYFGDVLDELFWAISILIIPALCRILSIKEALYAQTRQ